MNAANKFSCWNNLIKLLDLQNENLSIICSWLVSTTQTRISQGCCQNFITTAMDMYLVDVASQVSTLPFALKTEHLKDGKMQVVQ